MNFTVPNNLYTFQINFVYLKRILYFSNKFFTFQISFRIFQINFSFKLYVKAKWNNMKMN